MESSRPDLLNDMVVDRHILKKYALPLFHFHWDLKQELVFTVFVNTDLFKFICDA